MTSKAADCSLPIDLSPPERSIVPNPMVRQLFARCLALLGTLREEGADKWDRLFRVLISCLSGVLGLLAGEAAFQGLWAFAACCAIPALVIVGTGFPKIPFSAGVLGAVMIATSVGGIWLSTIVTGVPSALAVLAALL
jgi:hypothetical protein